MNFTKFKIYIFLFFALFESLSIMSQNKNQQYSNQPLNDVLELIRGLNFEVITDRNMFDGEVLLGKVKEIEIVYGGSYSRQNLRNKKVVRIFDENGYLKEFGVNNTTIKMITIENADSTKTIVDEESFSKNQIINYENSNFKYYRLFNKNGQLISTNQNFNYEYFFEKYLNEKKKSIFLLSYEENKIDKSTKVYFPSINSEVNYFEWDKNSNIISVGGNIGTEDEYKYKYQYNLSNKISKKIKLRDIGTEVDFITNYKYDDVGNIIKTFRTNVQGSDIYSINEYQNKYYGSAKQVFAKDWSYSTPVAIYNYDESKRINTIYSYGSVMGEGGQLELVIYKVIRIKYY